MRRAGRPLDDWQQDAVDLMLAVREDGKWACYEYCEWCSRQNGKGAILEARALAGLLLLGEELIMWSAHEYKTAMEAFRRVLWLLRSLGRVINDNLIEMDGADGPFYLKITTAHGEEGIERLPLHEADKGQRVKFIARSKSSGRGFSGDVNIIDETFAYAPTQQDALMPTLSARPNPQIIYTSSPPLTSESGDVMFKLRHRGDPSAPRTAMDQAWQQDDSLGYRDWGLAGDLEALEEFDLDSLEVAAQTNPAIGERPGPGIRITFETAQRERRSMGSVGYARERLGIWPRRVLGWSATAISEVLWREQIDASGERPVDIALCIQVNYQRTRTAIVAVGPRLEGGGYLTSMVDYRSGTDWVVARAAELKARWNPVAIAVQDKGPTGSLLEAMASAGLKESEDKDRPLRGDLVIPWADDVAAAYGIYVDALSQHRLWHLDEAPLNVAVASAETRQLSGATAWDYKQESDAPLLASTLAFWAYLTRIDAVSVEYDPLSDIW
jgi:hypothetical protein